MPAPSPLRVAVLCSHRAPGLMHLLTSARRGRDWDIVCCLTSEDALEGEQDVERHGVPVLHHELRDFYAQRTPPAALGDRGAREDYDRQTVRILREYGVECVVLAGYLWLLTAPMLTAFDGRIINVHHADLEQRNGSGGPRYAGLRAVRDAIRAGETETRSTAHLVTAALDDGPTLLRSEAFPVPPIAAWARANGADDVLRRVIWAHQEWMLRTAFGPLMEGSLALLTRAS